MNIGATILGHYKVTDIVADGGQAMVAKACDTRDRSFVAIKRLSAHSGLAHYGQSLQRFWREANTHVSHPNVVNPIEFGEQDGGHFIVFPFIDGRQLDLYIQAQGGRLSPSAATNIIRPIASALGAAHDQGITHRDVKPANILVDAQGTPYLIDFGVAQDNSEATIADKPGLTGTLLWMSPEQIQAPDNVDYRSDVFSLGGVFYFALTGKPPFDGNDVRTIALRICQDNPVPPSQLIPSIPAHVDRACLRLLAKDRGQRFQSAGEFLLATDQLGGAAAYARCPSCQTQLASGSAYCSRCGADCRPRQHACRCLACGGDVSVEVACPHCGRPFSSADHRLTFRFGPLTGIVFRVPEGSYVVGRDELEPRDGGISRCHLRVECLNGRIQIEDAGSTNKTCIDGQLATQPTLVSAGQEIRIAGNLGVYSCNP